MKKKNYCWGTLILCFILAVDLCTAMGISEIHNSEFDDNDLMTEGSTKKPQDRQFPVLIATGLNLNNTLVLAALAALASLFGLLPLLGLAGLFAGMLLNQNTYYSPHSDHGGYSSYR